MRRRRFQSFFPRIRALSISVLVAAFGLLLAWQTLQAQEREPLPPDLSGSVKHVDKEEAEPGETLNYTVVISNQGDEPAATVSVTDALPAHVAYISDSISVLGGGLYGVSGNVVTWTGAVNNASSVQISFDAVLSDTLMSGDEVTNTVNLNFDGSILTRTAVTAVFTDTSDTVWLPAIPTSIPLPPTPDLGPIPGPGVDNAWTLVWSVSNSVYVDEFEVQEASDPDFSDAITVATTIDYFLEVEKDPSPYNVYYYRVRGVGPAGPGPWSDAQKVIGNYRDDFRDGTTGWAIRRQDTDDIENYSYYNDDHFILEIDGRWDYGIAAPMKPAPEGPYAIETRVRLNEPGNLNSYGLIFGGDWDGTRCPNSDYSSCLNHYYRLNIIWFASPDSFKVSLSRIERHDPNTNAGRGPTLWERDAVQVSRPPRSYQVWRIEVYPTGLIRLLVNDSLVTEVTDDTYVDDPYFGIFASTDEYLGSEPWFDWYDVSVLPTQ